MSSVTTVLVSFGYGESVEAFDTEINRWLAGLPQHAYDDRRGGGGWSLGNLTSDEAVDAWGGSVLPFIHVFGAGLNHFEHLEADLLEYLRVYPWKEPQCVQVLLNATDDRRFRVYVLGADRNW